MIRWFRRRPNEAQIVHEVDSYLQRYPDAAAWQAMQAAAKLRDRAEAKLNDSRPD